MLNEARIAISGKSGCGNTTVSRLVAEEFGLRVINYTFKTMAAEMAISFEELCVLAESASRYDRELDQKQMELATAPGCVLGSRLAIWFLEDADFKVHLDGGARVRAARIADREGLTLEQSLAATNARDKRDRHRYLRLYKIDVDEYGFADLTVDTAAGDQFYVARTITEALRAKLER